MKGLILKTKDILQRERKCYGCDTDGNLKKTPITFTYFTRGEIRWVEERKHMSRESSRPEPPHFK